jgi:hypothetical protein
MGRKDQVTGKRSAATLRAGWIQSQKRKRKRRSCLLFLGNEEGQVQRAIPLQDPAFLDRCSRNDRDQTRGETSRRRACCISSTVLQPQCD